MTRWITWNEEGTEGIIPDTNAVSPSNKKVYLP